MYRRICIQENAYINDVQPKHYNDNYEQRRIALLDVLQLFYDDDPDGMGKAYAIRREVRQQRWTLEEDGIGRNKYICVDKG